MNEDKVRRLKLLEVNQTHYETIIILLITIIIKVHIQIGY